MLNFKQYEALSEKIKDSANSLWTRVTYLTVAEVVNQEVNIRELDSYCSELSDQSARARRAMSQAVDSLPEDQFDLIEREHSRVEDLFYKVESKLSAIDTILYRLKEIADSAEEEAYLDLFMDSKSFKIGESRILLERFEK